MYIIERKTQEIKAVSIAKLDDKDLKKITAKRYSFNWKKLTGVSSLYKLTETNNNDILGLIAVTDLPDEERIEIKLLTVSAENIGGNKIYDRIAGCLIAFTCREALRRYKDPCVSLTPKTILKKHYIKKYGMYDAGNKIYLDGYPLLEMIKEYL